MLIAIEGMDGSGKTSVTKEVTKRMNIKMIERPGEEIYGLSKEDEKKLIYKLYNSGGNNLTSWYYLMNYLILKKESVRELLILDRYFLSTYYYDYSEINSNIFSSFIELGGLADFTIILYASPETRVSRIKGRDPLDRDLKNKRIFQDEYWKYFEATKKFEIPHLVIDTDILTLDETVDLCLQVINAKENNDLKKINEISDQFDINRNEVQVQKSTFLVKTNKYDKIDIEK